VKRLIVVTSLAVLLSACGTARSVATIREAQTSTTTPPTEALKKAPPELRLSNADAGRSYSVPIGTTIIVILNPPPQWTPNRVLGRNTPVGAPLQLKSDSISGQGSLVIAYLAAATGQGKVGSSYPCTTIPPVQCASAVWSASITVSSETTTTVP
jgi:hypothetical protein